MEQTIRKPGIAFLRKVYPLWLKRLGHQRPAPKSQAEIDRLSKGWERESQSLRARMARIGI
ncbi:MAG TPA: hypothetical protein VKN18_06420 [Blastocatellia bacterium]|nr:hypothetical protein [Blastocatellia bacterium]